MKPLLCFALLATISTFIACKKDEPYNPYPVWILYMHAVEVNENGIQEPVHGCPQVVFKVLPTGSDSIVGCEGGHSNLVKVWNHIDSTITIQYQVTCPNYYDSDERQLTFRMEDVVQAPGRDGPEVIINEEVIMLPE